MKRSIIAVSIAATVVILASIGGGAIPEAHAQDTYITYHQNKYPLLNYQSGELRIDFRYVDGNGNNISPPASTAIYMRSSDRLQLWDRHGGEISLRGATYDSGDRDTVVIKLTDDQIKEACGLDSPKLSSGKNAFAQGEAKSLRFDIIFRESNKGTCLGQPPVLAPIGNQVVVAGETLQITLSATTDGLPVKFSKHGVQGTLVDNVYTLSIPKNNTRETYNVIFRATTDAGTDAERINIQVLPTLKLSSIGDKTVQVGDTLRIRLSATNLPELTFSHAGVGSLSGSTYSFTPTQTGTHTVTFTATAGTQTISETITITATARIVPPAPSPPVLAPIGDKSARVGDTLVIPFEATDPDGLPITYHVAKHFTDGVIFYVHHNGTHYTVDTAIPQTFRLTFTATAGGESDAETITVTIGQKTGPPIVDAGPDRTVNFSPGATVSLSGTASDPDGDTLTYSWELIYREYEATGTQQKDRNTRNTPDSLKAEFAGSTLSHQVPLGQSQPSNEVVYVMQLTVSDGVNTVSDRVKITSTIPNRAPIVHVEALTEKKISGGVEVQEQAPFLLRGTVSDPDGDDLACRWHSSNSLLHNQIVDRTSLTTWVKGIAYDDGGDHSELSLFLFFTCNDNNGKLTTSSNNIQLYDTVPTILTNQPPGVYAGEDQTLQLKGSQEFNFDAWAYDTEGDTLTYSWSTDAPNLDRGYSDEQIQGTNDLTATSFEQSKDRLKARFTIRDANPGVTTFTLTVSDGTHTVSDTVLITVVGETNPVAYAGQDQTVQHGERVCITDATASDPNGDALTYRWVPLNGWSIFEDDTVLNACFTAYRAQGDYAGTPGINKYTMLLIVSDGMYTDIDRVTFTME